MHNVFVICTDFRTPAGVSRSHSNKNSFRAVGVRISSSVRRQTPLVFMFDLRPILLAEGTITSSDNSVFG